MINRWSVLSHAVCILVCSFSFLSVHYMYCMYVIYTLGTDMEFKCVSSVICITTTYFDVKDVCVCLCVAFPQALSFCSLPGLMLDALQGQSRSATAQIPFPSFSYRLTVTSLRRAGSSYEIKRKYLCSRFFLYWKPSSDCPTQKVTWPSQFFFNRTVVFPGERWPSVHDRPLIPSASHIQISDLPSSYLCAAVPEQTRSSAFIKVKAADTCTHTRTQTNRFTCNYPPSPGFSSREEASICCVVLCKSFDHPPSFCLLVMAWKRRIAAYSCHYCLHTSKTPRVWMEMHLRKQIHALCRPSPERTSCKPCIREMDFACGNWRRPTGINVSEASKLFIAFDPLLCLASYVSSVHSPPFGSTKCPNRSVTVMPCGERYKVEAF